MFCANCKGSAFAAKYPNSASSKPAIILQLLNFLDLAKSSIDALNMT